MNKIPPIKAVMTTFPYSIDVGDSIESAKQMMAEHEIRHLPVTENGKLVSVVTDNEVALALQAKLASSTETIVDEICMRDAYIIDMNQPLDLVLTTMAEAHRDSALVVRDGRLVGIFTAADAFRSYGALLRTLFPRSGDDNAA